MPIDCGYCGGTHPTAKDVKACWEDRGRPKYNRSPSRKSVKSNKRRRPSELLHDGPSSAKRKRGSKAGPGSAKPKKSKTYKCSACGMAISIDGKCGCS